MQEPSPIGLEEVVMLTEHEVRKQVQTICEVEDRPEAKVRLLLRLARRLKAQARALLHARALSVRDLDLRTAAHMDRMAQGLRMLYEEVRWTAHRVARAISNADLEYSLA